MSAKDEPAELPKSALSIAEDETDLFLEEMAAAHEELLHSVSRELEDFTSTYEFQETLDRLGPVASDISAAKDATPGEIWMERGFLYDLTRGILFRFMEDLRGAHTGRRGNVELDDIARLTIKVNHWATETQRILFEYRGRNSP